MSALTDLKATLEDRFELLDDALNSERVQSEVSLTFNELRGRHEECKVTLELVNFLAEQASEFHCGYCDCECGTPDSLYEDDRPGACGCGQSEFCGDAEDYPEDDLDISLTLDGVEVTTLSEFEQLQAYNTRPAAGEAGNYNLGIQTYFALKKLGLPIPYDLLNDLLNECWPLDPDNPDNQPRGTSWQP